MKIRHSLWSLFALGGILGFTSCSEEVTDPSFIADGEEVEVTFNLSIPEEFGTRATEASQIKHRLVFQVFDANGNPLDAYPLTEVGANTYTPTFNGKNNYSLSNSDTDTKRKLRFIKGQTYQIAFWAQYVDINTGYVNGKRCTNTDLFVNDAFDYSDLRAVKIDYSKIANNDKVLIGNTVANQEEKEYYDAYYAAEKFTVAAASQTINVTMRRPFAQVNVGITEAEWNRVKELGFNITDTKAVLPAYNTINLLDGSVSGFEKVTYDFAEIPSLTNGVENNKKLSVTTYTVPSGQTEAQPNTTEYYYVSKNYILAPSAKTTDAMEFTFHPDNTSFDDVVLSQGLTAAPYQRNFRTNILLNNFLTGTVTFNITIDPMFSGDYNSTDAGAFGNQIAEGVGYDYNTETFYLTDKAGINWLRTQLHAASLSALLADITSNGTFEGKTVVLTTDIDFTTNGKPASFVPLADPLTTPTVNHVFKGTFDGGNHTISNITVSKTYNANYSEKEVLAGFFGYAEGATIKNLKIQNATFTSAQKVGAIVAYAKNTTIENCNVDNVTIKSNPRKDSATGVYYDGSHAGGIVGYYEATEDASAAPVLQNCYVKNAEISAYSNVGGVVGTVSGATAVVGRRTTAPATVVNTIDNVNIIANQFIGTHSPAEQPNANKIYGGAVEGATPNTNGTTINTFTNTILNNVYVTVYAADANGGFSIGEKTDLSSLPDLVVAEGGLQSVTMDSDVSGDARKGGYSKTGIVIDGVTFDGDNHTLNVQDANTTWDCAVYTKGGTIKNLTVTGAFRGIFMSGANDNLYVENVTLKGTRFTLSTDGGNKEYGLYFKKSGLYGWTSFTSSHKEVIFENCTFGKGEGWAEADNGIDYAFCRPYAETWFRDCDFEEGFELDTNQAVVHLVNCRLNGVPITSKNITTLCPPETKQGGILKGYNMYKAANVKYVD